MSLAKTLLTAFIALSLAAMASAQIPSATGAVTDQSGAVATNAEVVITNSGTNFSYRTKTTEAGLYRMPCLEAGTYTVEVTLAGFVPFRETGLAIATDQTARVDVNLKVGTVGGSETPATVEVAAQAAQIQADSSAVTNATDAQVIDDVTNVTQIPLFYAMLQNGVQPRNETSTSTLGDL
jgi:hypothetical protein